MQPMNRARRVDSIRAQEKPFGRKAREPINWPLCLMVAGALFMALSALAIKFVVAA